MEPRLIKFVAVPAMTLTLVSGMTLLQQENDLIYEIIL
tara:strand:+ start:399 stop:512 length:114 start_codon:yes stop_codon:yes gene_type:complete